MVEVPAKETSFIAEDPLEILASGNYNKVPVLMGYCKDEGIFTEVILTRVGKAVHHSDFEDLINHRLGVKKGSEVSRKIAEKIKEFYYPERQPRLDPIQAFYDVRIVFFNCCLRSLLPTVLVGIGHKIRKRNPQHCETLSSYGNIACFLLQIFRAWRVEYV